MRCFLAKMRSSSQTCTLRACRAILNLTHLRKFSCMRFFAPPASLCFAFHFASDVTRRLSQNAQGMLRGLQTIASYTLDSTLDSICAAAIACVRFRELRTTTPFLECSWVPEALTLQTCLKFASITNDSAVHDVSSAVQQIYDSCTPADAVILLHELESRFQCAVDRDCFETESAFSHVFSSPVVEESLVKCKPFQRQQPVGCIEAPVKAPVFFSEDLPSGELGMQMLRRGMHDINLKEMIPEGCSGQAYVAGGFITRCVAFPYYSLEERNSRMFPYARSDCDIYLVGKWTQQEARAFTHNVYMHLMRIPHLSVNQLLVTANAVNISVFFDWGWGVIPVNSYAIRRLQIMLTTYRSLPELLFTFDLCPCVFAFDGDQVFSLPRGRRALRTGYMTGFPTTDARVAAARKQCLTVLSTGRLVKYLLKGFSYVDYFPALTALAEVSDVLQRGVSNLNTLLVEVEGEYERDLTLSTLRTTAVNHSVMWLESAAFFERLAANGDSPSEQGVVDNRSKLWRVLLTPPASLAGSPMARITFPGYFLDSPWDGVTTTAAEIDERAYNGLRIAMARRTTGQGRSQHIEAFYYSSLPAPTGNEILVWREYTPKAGVPWMS